MAEGCSVGHDSHDMLPPKLELVNIILVTHPEIRTEQINTTPVNSLFLVALIVAVLSTNSKFYVPKKKETGRGLASKLELVRDLARSRSHGARSLLGSTRKNPPGKEQSGD